MKKPGPTISHTISGCQQRIVPKLPRKGSRRPENPDVSDWVRGESGCPCWCPNRSTSDRTTFDVFFFEDSESLETSGKPKKNAEEHHIFPRNGMKMGVKSCLIPHLQTHVDVDEEKGEENGHVSPLLAHGFLVECQSCQPRTRLKPDH
jgi:hypothetical protein